MAINSTAVENHGYPIQFRNLIAFDDDERRRCAELAMAYYTLAKQDKYEMFGGLPKENWQRIVYLLADANPHWAHDLKAEAMRKVIRVSGRLFFA